MSPQSAKIRLFFLALPFFLMGPVWPAMADSAIKCHCFTERDYNPVDKFAADDYILATSFNSLLARLADLPKKQIVMLKMKRGVAQEDLLVGLKIAGITDYGLEEILDLKGHDRTWPEIVAALDLQTRAPEDEILKGLLAGSPPAEAGEAVAAQLIAGFFGTSAERIKELRLAGLNEKEITLIHILSHVSEIEPPALAGQYKDNGRSWSEIAYNLGVEPKTAGRLILAYPAGTIPADR